MPKVKPTACTVKKTDHANPIVRAMARARKDPAELPALVVPVKVDNLSHYDRAIPAFGGMLALSDHIAATVGTSGSEAESVRAHEMMLRAIRALTDDEFEDLYLGMLSLNTIVDGVRTMLKDELSDERPLLAQRWAEESGLGEVLRAAKTLRDAMQAKANAADTIDPNLN